MTASTKTTKKATSTKSTTKKVVKPIEDKIITDPIVDTTVEDTSPITTGMFKSEPEVAHQEDKIVSTDQPLGGMFKSGTEEVTPSPLELSEIPAPTFMNSFSDAGPILEEAPVAVVEETPVAVVEEAPVAVVEEAPVAVVEEAPVAVVEEAPVAVVEEAPASPIVFSTLTDQAHASQPVSMGSVDKGIESLKSKAEFKDIDIDAIIANTDPTSTGAMVTNGSAVMKLPSGSSNLKKTFAIGGGVFVLLGAGLWVLSTMYSGGLNTEADVLQADIPAPVEVIKEQENIGGAITDTDEEVNDTRVTETQDTPSPTPTTQTTTNTQPSFGPATGETSDPDLIEQVGEPTNALVDTVGHIAAVKEKLNVATNVLKDATAEDKLDAVKYANFAIIKYKDIISKLENGEYNSNKDVTDMISKIDQFYNKAIDIMNQ